jgi:hypothetical protein
MHGIDIYIHTYIKARIDVSVHASIHGIYIYMHTYIKARIDVSVHTCIHGIYIYIHTYVHTHTHRLAPRGDKGRRKKTDQEASAKKEVES